MEVELWVGVGGGGGGGVEVRGEEIKGDETRVIEGRREKRRQA